MKMRNKREKVASCPWTRCSPPKSSLARSRAAARDADAASSRTAVGTAPILPGSRAPPPPAHALPPELKLKLHRLAPSPAAFRAGLLREAAPDRRLMMLGRRLKIASKTSRALEHLHSSRIALQHGDHVIPSNILLDDGFMTKVTAFTLIINKVY
uniref:Protein kinase domain-containing protein n=1 Tax=Oryza barthii TaxID=65489 RepID=A0A0D3HN11_9ORYZ